MVVLAVLNLECWIIQRYELMKYFFAFLSHDVTLDFDCLIELNQLYYESPFVMDFQRIDDCQL